MTQEERQLLLADLCARIPYKLNVCLYKETCVLMGIDGYEVYLDIDSDSFRIESIKPYLRKLSSMTEEEKKEYYTFHYKFTLQTYEYQELNKETFSEYLDWLNKHHFDYRGLIDKGLALKAPNGMYNLKKR